MDEKVRALLEQVKGAANYAAFRPAARAPSAAASAA